MRVNVSEEAVDKVVWYKASIARPFSGIRYIDASHSVKERFLADEEIIEHLVVSLHACIRPFADSMK